MLSKTLKSYSDIRIKAVKRYFTSGSLDEVAASFDIHTKTLRRWVKWYKDGGEENLKRGKKYRKSPNRFAAYIERKIVLLKERKPSITISDAKNALIKKGIKVSRAGVWGIWKRYKLAGFPKRDFSLTTDIRITPEIREGLKKAEKALLIKKDINRAARILNALPTCAGNGILKQIPDRLLSLQRQIEKISLTFGEIPFQDTLLRASRLRKQTEKKGLLYSSMHAGIAELFAMIWQRKLKDALKLSHQLEKRLESENRFYQNKLEPNLYFNLLFTQGTIFAYLGQVKEAFSRVKKCEKLVRSYPYSSFYLDIASLYSAIGFNRNYGFWLRKYLECSKEADMGIFDIYLADYFSLDGQYMAVRKVLKKVHIEKRGLKSSAANLLAKCFLGEGKIYEAAISANKSLLESRKEDIPDYFGSSSLMLAYCSCALGEKKKAKMVLKRTVSILEKLKAQGAIFLRVFLEQDFFPESGRINTFTKLALMLRKASKSLRIKNYRKAYNYAAAQQLMGLFHRLVFFYPEIVNKVIAKGKPTGLTKPLLKLPVFQKDIPVYHLEFLGPVRISRNGIELRTKLTPMYCSFLIQIAFEKKIELNSLYNNFWQHVKSPSLSLSHLLYGLRKYLRLPSNILFIKKGFLHFRGYITTDYQYYKETIIRAKALEQAGEWVFAKKEYLRAFKSFRGEPFRKMYDPWSEHIRRVILNKLETEVLHFAKSCVEYKNRKDARKVLEKVARIIPQSTEIENMAERLGIDGRS